MVCDQPYNMLIWQHVSRFIIAFYFLEVYSDKSVADAWIKRLAGPTVYIPALRMPKWAAIKRV